jgi:hypothetical protein
MMQILNYHSNSFESDALAAIRVKQAFAVSICGWRRSVISKGLPIFLDSLDLERRRASNLKLLPFGIITPMFWGVCIRAGFENLLPSWRLEDNRLIVSFI